ncbi:hypothetical protein Tco_0059740, partial [Tanacetum coccineum]
SGDADLSKAKSGAESPPEFRRSFHVEGHIRSGVISSVLAQRHLRNSPKKGDRMALTALLAAEIQGFLERLILHDQIYHSVLWSLVSLELGLSLHPSNLMGIMIEIKLCGNLLDLILLALMIVFMPGSIVVPELTIIAIVLCRLLLGRIAPILRRLSTCFLNKSSIAGCLRRLLQCIPAV